jgi:predicted ferric reductase
MDRLLHESRQCRCDRRASTAASCHPGSNSECSNRNAPADADPSADRADPGDATANIARLLMSWKVAAAVAGTLVFLLVVARLVQDQDTGTATWDASRASGFAAYLLLWASTVTGLALHLRVRPARGPLTWMLEWHRITSALAFSFLLAHVMALLLDPVVHFNVVDGLLPFTSSYRSIQVGMGTLAQWMLVTVLASTALAGAMPYATWRGVHYLGFPAYLLALLHSLTSGTDSSNTLALLIYASTAGTVAFLCVARFYGRAWVPVEV